MKFVASKEIDDDENYSPARPTLIDELMTQRWMMLVLVLGVAGALAYLIHLQNQRNNELLQGFRGNLGNGNQPPIQINNYTSPQGFPQLFQETSGNKGLLGDGITRNEGTKTNNQIINNHPAYPKAETPIEASRIASLATKLFTTTLSSTQPTRLFQAVGDKIWRVQVRTVSPPGSFSIVATDPSVLINSNDIADAAIVPAGGGGFSEIYLHPNQGLWARGNIANVVISILASAERL